VLKEDPGHVGGGGGEGAGVYRGGRGRRGGMGGNQKEDREGGKERGKDVPFVAGL